jgi:hypothetical protein
VDRFAGNSGADINAMRVMEDEAQDLVDVRRPKDLAP